MKQFKRVILCVALGLGAMSSYASKPLKDWAQSMKLGGYLVGRYTWNDREGQTDNGGFNMRYVRLYTTGKLLDFNYKVQVDFWGLPNADTGSGTHLVDAWAEWSKFSFLKIKGGQFKRPFSFESPYNPIDIGLHDYAQSVRKFTGFGDRVGERSGGGRDLGIQVQGDLLPVSADAHTLLHYQIGVFNGQGINTADVDKKKDLIGGAWISPVKELRIGAFGWTGSYARKGGDGKVVSVDRNRWSVGVDYESDWVVRSEYFASEGRSFKTTKTSDTELSSHGNKADGWYATVGAPLVGNKLKLYGRWDVYRDRKSMHTATQIYTASLNYRLNKNLLVQGSYYFTHDKSTPSADANFNTVNVQLYLRF